jgi:hypothetical protein
VISALQLSIFIWAVAEGVDFGALRWRVQFFGYRYQRLQLQHRYCFAIAGSQARVL